MTVADVLVHVARLGSASNLDLATWFVEAARLAGRSAEVVMDDLPKPGQAINIVVAPHEYFDLTAATPAVAKRAAASSVCISTAGPRADEFERTVDAARVAVATYAMSKEGVDLLRARRIAARRLQLGAVPSMADAFPESPSADRAAAPIDVLFVGTWSERRGAALADLAPTLLPRRSALHLAIDAPPITAETPGTLGAGVRREMLRNARTILDVRVTDDASFEWAQAIEAMANHCVVVADHDVHGPISAGVHYVSAAGSDLGSVLNDVLENEGRMRRLAESAHQLVTGDLAFHHAVDAMLTDLEQEQPVARRSPRATRWLAGSVDRRPPMRLGPFRPFANVRNSAQTIALAESAALRRIDAARSVLRHGTPHHIEYVETPSFSRAAPEVSVIVSVYNYADVVERALHSAIASRDVSFEVIVVDDHATDHSRDVVRRVLDEHPAVPMLLVGKDANEGLAAARNSAFERARSPLIMVLDADNEISPTCLRRLADALDADPGADAAYGLLEDFGDHRGVRSAFPWDVRLLCQANYIDAQAMIRKAMWSRLGGYRSDDDVFGWEDWDLWLRLAQDGGRALLVPELLGRYRVQQGSMIALTNLGHDRSRASLRMRYPALPWQD